MSGKKSKSGGLGRALMKNPAQPTKRKGYVDEWGATQYPDEPKPLESIIDASDIQGIMENVSMQNQRFLTERQNVVVLSTTAFVVQDKLSPEQIEAQQKHWNDLTIPRRPEWTTDMTPHELDRIEKESFLIWRRKLSDLEQNENLLLTPFEKNIDIWRQLWRVIERSDLIVQILDARDPLLFRSLDLEKYVEEFKTRKSGRQKKIKVLLLNKADLLTAQQRKAWADYFRSEGIRFAFFSAFQEQMKINEESKETKLSQSLKEGGDGDEIQNIPGVTNDIPNVPNFNQRKLAKNKRRQEIAREESDDDDSEDEAESDDEETEAEPGSDDKEGKTTPESTEDNAAAKAFEDFRNIPVSLNSDKVLSREELFAYFHKICSEELEEKKEHITVGMVGYPNVGKSSTINVLYYLKKVAVSATPGKTKHFQTLKVNDALTLCDCPGLVFPSFMSTRAEMTASGLLRIDEMKDYLGPVSVVARRIPREVLNHTYGVAIKGSLYTTAGEFLRAYAHVRGFYVTLQKPDESKAARIVLKDFVNGKLLFCRSPPTMEQEAYNKFTRHPTFPEFNQKREEDEEDEEEEEFDPTAPVVDEDGDLRTEDGTFVKPKFSGRIKHERVNRRKERRMKHLEEREPDRKLDKEQEVGVWKSNNSGHFGKPLPTTVKLVKIPKKGVAIPKASLSPSQVYAMKLAQAKAMLAKERELRAAQAAAGGGSSSSSSDATPSN